MRTFTILSSVLSLIALSAPLAQAVVADGQKCDGRPNGDWSVTKCPHPASRPHVLTRHPCRACMSVPEGQAARNQFQCIGGVWHFERTCEFDDPATGFEGVPSVTYSRHCRTLLIIWHRAAALTAPVDFCDAGPGTWKTAGGFTAAYCASEHHQE